MLFSGCLRDDVIFFIYLYQKWLYPTDMKRTNEFGISGEQAAGINTDSPPSELPPTEPTPLPLDSASSVDPPPTEEKTAEEKKGD